MGKVEKTIVLGVLFVIAVILVVSLTVDDPLDKQHVVMPGAASPRATQEKPAAPIVAPTLAQANTAAPTPADPSALTQPPGAAPSAVLSAGIQPATAEPVSPPPAPAGVEVPAGSLLKTGAGLQDGFNDDLKFYIWQEGDTFRTVATRFYGDPTKVTLLRRFNEGRFDVTPGERIYIPVFDVDGPRTPVVAATDERPASAPSASSPVAPAASASPSGTRLHVVKEGESLWKIAKQELGSGARWKEIFEANRDVMTSPEALHSGLKLRIP